MFVREGRKKPRNQAAIVDFIHIGAGIVIVVLSVFAFLNPEQNQFLLPIIFVIAGALHAMNGWMDFQDSGRDKKRKAGALFVCVIAGMLFVIGGVSAFSLWR